MFNTIIAIVIGYLLGSIPFAYISGHFKKGVDIRQMGGGNMGALNVMHEVGVRIGYIVLIADMAKGAMAVLIAQWLGLDMIWVLVVGFAAVAGHNWPVFLKFRGGKGAATTMGVLLALVPREFGISFAITCIVIVITSNPVLGISVGFAFLPLIIWRFNGSGMLIVYSLLLSIFLGIRYFAAYKEPWPILVVSKGLFSTGSIISGKRKENSEKGFLLYEQDSEEESIYRN